MEETWSARTVRPMVAAGVAAVFLAFMALAWFGFGSAEAVQALLFAGVAAMVGLTPSLLGRVEYRLTENGVEGRPVRAREPKPFEPLFAWEELGEVVPTRAGFKYYKRVDASGPMDRFLKRHVLGGYSGEVQVEADDLHRVRSLLAPRVPGRLPGD